jgi:hypothetical protein
MTRSPFFVYIFCPPQRSSDHAAAASLADCAGEVLSQLCPPLGTLVWCDGEVLILRAMLCYLPSTLCALDLPHRLVPNALLGG